MKRKGFDGFVFSRTNGVKHWCCPACNHINRSVVRVNMWILRCSNERCEKRWAIGEVFYELSKGIKAPPPDTILPREEKLRQGALVNQAHCSTCAKVLYEGFKHGALEDVGALMDPREILKSEEHGALEEQPVWSTPEYHDEARLKHYEAHGARKWGKRKGGAWKTYNPSAEGYKRAGYSREEMESSKGSGNKPGDGSENASGNLTDLL